MTLKIEDTIETLNIAYANRIHIEQDNNCFIIKELTSGRVERIQRSELIDVAYGIMCEERFSFGTSFNDFKLLIKNICLNLILFSTDNTCEIQEENSDEN